VWTDYRWPSDDGVYLHERPPGGPWGEPQLLPTAGTGYVRDLVLSVNAAGDVVLVWRGGGITAMRRPAGGTWSAQQTWSSPGSAGANGGCPNKPVAAIGDNGSVVVAWTSYQILQRQRFAMACHGDAVLDRQRVGDVPDGVGPISR
jgi:hypothetical protein